MESYCQPGILFFLLRIYLLLSRPEARFPITHGVRPVGGVAGYLVQAGLRELDQQTVTSPFTVKEAQTPQIVRPGRGWRFKEPVPDDLHPGPPEETHRFAEQHPRHVAALGESCEVEHVTVLSR